MSQEPEPRVLHEPLFVMRNKHYESCGQPPLISNEGNPRMHCAYFENDSGEQLIFVYDYKGLLYHGDAGWEKPWRVIDGAAPGLSLGAVEQMWLVTCWCAATRSPLTDTIKRANAQYVHAARDAQRHIQNLERKAKQTGKNVLDLLEEEGADSQEEM